jgi:hypothetical protein
MEQTSMDSAPIPGTRYPPSAAAPICQHCGETFGWYQGLGYKHQCRWDMTEERIREIVRNEILATFESAERTRKEMRKP